MNIEKVNPNIKYIYHYTLKKNVKQILNDKVIKSKDKYVFFTKSLDDSIIAFDREMMQENKLYIDVEGVLRKREKCNKDDYCILKIPYTDDNEFYKFNFENQKQESIYTLAITHKGKYKFENAKVLEFPKQKKKKLNVSNKMAVAAFATGIMLFPYNTYAASWLDTGNYDTSWYTSETATSYYINTANKVAGLAHLVNNENKTFVGKRIYISEDVDLTQNTWVTIKDIFQGNICGGHRIILNYLDGEFAKNKIIDSVVYSIKILENNKNLKDVIVLQPYTVSRLKQITSAESVFLNNKELTDDKSLLDLELKENDIIDIFTSHHIYIQDSKGIKIPLSFESGNSVIDTLETYSNIVNIPKEKIIFKYNERELNVERTLADYNIQKLETINAYVKFDIIISVDEGEGSITSSKTTALPGEKITITLNPNLEYELSKLMVNGIEKTSKVQNNELEIECGEEDVNVKVSYKLKQQEETNDNIDLNPDNNVETEKNELITNPETEDNIIVYITTFITSVIGLIICKYKK